MMYVAIVMLVGDLSPVNPKDYIRAGVGVAYSTNLVAVASGGTILKQKRTKTYFQKYIVFKFLFILHKQQ